MSSGKLGEAKIIISTFSQQVRSGNSRLKKDVGGGAVYDLGVYCINAARYLSRDQLEEVFAWNVGRDDERFREVEPFLRETANGSWAEFPGQA